ncbi:hypothetical protein SXCC_01463 [Gluconacetobacter sp. SXCC-1]|nr:hypothetical protein CT154_00200 [Komagataeibacter xylinus]EGG78068.1 hypothetical protein SXCC_01463 [Gluconacetobacter sp. SXCC-1]
MPPIGRDQSVIMPRVVAVTASAGCYRHGSCIRFRWPASMNRNAAGKGAGRMVFTWVQHWTIVQ